MKKITELSDSEMLDFLMTSDFENNLSPDELKTLLLRWRKLYTILYSKNKLLIDDLNLLNNNLKLDNEYYKNINVKLIKDIDERDIIINSLKQNKSNMIEKIKKIFINLYN
jgi:hypothetical protein